jgi:bifunctional ADP-heptose synthase (sugar kinase/adenylyltransferase)
MRRLHLANLLVTMGARGSVLFRPRENDPAQWFTNRLRSEHIPSLVRHVVDPLGAGDACLAISSLTLAAGFDTPTAAFLGMVAAAIQTSRVGNPLLEQLDLIRAVDHSAFLPHTSARTDPLADVVANGAAARTAVGSGTADRRRNRAAVRGSEVPDDAVRELGHAGNGF